MPPWPDKPAKPTKLDLDRIILKHRIKGKVDQVIDASDPTLEEASEVLAERIGRMVITQNAILPADPEEIEGEGQALLHDNGDADYEEDPEYGSWSDKKKFKRGKGKNMIERMQIKPLQFHGHQQGMKYIPSALTRRMVKILVACGIPHDVICTILQITKQTLYAHYRVEIDTGAHEINARIAHRLYSIALHGQGKEAIVAMMFWLKTRAGWRDSVNVQHTGLDGGPIEHTFRALTHEERAARLLQVFNAGTAKGN